MPSPKSNTSWEPVANWYDSLVGEKGSYFHTHVIFPKLLNLLSIKPGQKILDIACGQGALARLLAQKGGEVTGVDRSETLLDSARKYDKKLDIRYILDDARYLNELKNEKFDRVTCVLALQNMDPIDQLFKRVHELLLDNGRFVVVLMHPCFRAPRISGWDIDQNRKLMYRRVDRYLSPMKVPISTHPGKEQSEFTWAFHRPLSEYVKLARQAHLYLDVADEWVSDKVSVGKNADMENLARNEIPMFLALRMKRLNHA